MSKDQGSNAVNAIVKAELGEDKLASLQRGLESVGVEADDITLAIATAVAVGMETSTLLNPKNLQALKQASDAMRVYGMLPNRHFYMQPFGYGASTTYSFVLSVDYLDYCAKRAAMDMGIGVVCDIRPVMGASNIKDYLDTWAHPDYIEHPANRVALARYVPVISGVRQIGVNEGWEMASVGIYLHEGYLVEKDGKTKKTGGSAHMIAGRTVNRAPINIAMTRAQREAARRFSRSLYGVGVMDDKAMLEIANIAQRKLDDKQAIDAIAGLDSADIEDGEFTDIPQDPPEAGTPVPTAESEGYEEKPIVVQEEKPKAKKTKKEAPVPAPEPEKIEVEDEDDIAGDNNGGPKSVEESWRDITSAIRASLPEDTRAWCDGLIAAENMSGKPVTPKNLVNLRSWCGAFAGVSADSQLDEGVTMGDAILAVLFNVPIAEVPGVDNRAFIRLADAAGTKDGNSLVQDPKSEGARHIKVVAAELKNYEASEWTS